MADGRAGGMAILLIRVFCQDLDISSHALYFALEVREEWSVCIARSCGGSCCAAQVRSTIAKN